MTYDYWLRLVIPYTLLIFFLFPISVETYKGKNIIKSIGGKITFIYLIYLVFTFGLRDFNIGSDTLRYARYFTELGNFESYSEYIQTARNTGIGLFLFGQFIHFFTSDPTFFLLGVAILFLSLLYWLIREMTSDNKIIVLFSFVSCFFFYSMNINIIRDGVSLMLMLLGIVFWEKNRKTKWVFIVLSVLFHFTSILIFIVYWLVKRVKKLEKLKLANIVWIVCVLLSVAGIGVKSILSTSYIPIISYFINTFDYSGYIENTKEGYQTGFRIDFTIFGLIFILIGNWVNKKLKNKNYNLILCAFIYLNAFFVLAYDMQYSDRIGLLSWVLIPLLVSKPLLENNIIRKKKILWWYALMLVVGVFSFILSYPL